MATPVPENSARLTAWDVAAATGGSILHVEGDGRVARGVTTDSRAVRAGGAFVALRGETHDGHGFLASAVDQGAALLVVERGRALRGDTRADVVEVSDTLVAWGDIARAHLRAWRRERMPEASRVVAITGSAGKTTTKEICAALLRTQRGTLATSGNLNNRIGLPAMALCTERAHQFVVLEMGMSVPGEIGAMASIARADVAILLNVGIAHAAGVGGRAGVAAEKGAIVQALGATGVAVVNADDEAARGQLARTHAARGVLFGRAADADYRLVSRTADGARGSQLTVTRRRPGGLGLESLSVFLPLVGEAAAIDFVAALAAADAAVGKPVVAAQVAEALADLAPVRGRAEVVELAGGVTVIDDAYNANPASMRAALAVLAEIAGATAERRRCVAVVGEMKELGAFEASEHRAFGDALADAGISLAIGCGGAIDLALLAAEARGVRVVRASDAAAAAIAAVEQVSDGDVVLVKGSRSVGAERVVVALTQARARTGAEVRAKGAGPTA